MAYRQFVDADGVEWTVYDVIPRTSDRRSADRRDSAQYADESQLDRRGDDRRAPVVSVHRSGSGGVGCASNHRAIGGVSSPFPKAGIFCQTPA
jgi:hypothetical protein